MITVSNILRDKHGTARQIVKTCQVSQVTACSWIRGASVPHMKYIRDLATISNTHYNRLVQARKNARSMARTPKSGTRMTRGQKALAVTTPTPPTNERRCHLMKVASMFATLSSDEKVVVGMMADALALLEKGASK